jgi:transcriptional pleiotropic repressor
MGKSMIERTQAFNRSIQNMMGNQLCYREIAELLAGSLDCNVYLVDNKERLIEYALDLIQVCPRINKVISQMERYPKMYGGYRTDTTETIVNLPLEENACVFLAQNIKCPCHNPMTLLIPIYGKENIRLGTVIFVKDDDKFSDEDTIIAEYGVAIMSSEIVRMQSSETKNRELVQSAVATLSYSEQVSLKTIVGKLEGNDGMVSVSRIAAQLGFGKTSAFTALRKIASAGIIETMSLGRKGVYIKVLNDNLFDELRKNKLGKIKSPF